MLPKEEVMHPLLCLVDNVASVACYRAERLEGKQLQQVARMEGPLRSLRWQKLPCTESNPLS